MKKIAVITQQAVKNYGSVLQAWATQQILEKKGYEVEIIDFRRPWEADNKYYSDLFEKSFLGLIKNMVFLPTKMYQKHIFSHFLNSRLKLTQHTYTTPQDFRNYPIGADAYCTGSDQVWNSGWNRGIIGAYYLDFLDDSQFRFSFASSMGNEQISDEEKKLIKEYLEKYNMLSVREKSSVKILESMGFNDVSLILDPTLQLERKDWKTLIQDEEGQAEEYILLIQLYHNRSFDKFAVNFSKEKGLPLKRLCLRLDQAILPGKSIVIPEVQDYVKYIANAKYVLTDSFHAIAFSLNFNKQFYAILPDKYSTRLKSILELTGLSRRIIQNYRIEKDQVDLINYESVNEILDGYRKESNRYLDKTLNMI